MFPLPFTYRLIICPFMISCSAGGSGAIAAFVTSPLDLAKLRMQIGTSNLGMIGSLRSIYYREGISGLFKGAGARVSHSFFFTF